MAEKKPNKSQQSLKAPKNPPKEEVTAPAEPENRENDLTIVGIGASAGGLAALGNFFDALPSETGMAFVVITHLHPDHESRLAELLQKHTKMPTMQVVEKVKIETGHV